MAERRRNGLSLAEIVALGIGGMIGGGIFAVLGLAIGLAGHAVALTLGLGGVIALLTGLSYAHLGLAFRDDGGSFTYIERGFRSTTGAAIAGWILIAGYVGTLALYATAFGAYGATLAVGPGAPAWVGNTLAAGVLVAFLAINLAGAKTSGRTELWIVAIKLTILALFAAAALRTVHADHFMPVFDKGIGAPLVAAALIFVAFEGFELIPNAVEEMAAPERDLRRALVISVVLTTIIYIVVALAALGSLTPAEIQHDQEYVLAVAARPSLGQFGFILIGIAALLSTASAINATLFGSARLAMDMAKEHALPQLFALRERNRPVPWVALVTLTAISVAFAELADLSVISAFASATFLLIFALVNFAALTVRRQIGIAWPWPLAGGVLSTLSFAMLIWHTWRTAPASLLWIAGAYGTAAVVEGGLAIRRGTWRHASGDRRLPNKPLHAPPG